MLINNSKVGKQVRNSKVIISKRRKDLAKK